MNTKDRYLCDGFIYFSILNILSLLLLPIIQTHIHTYYIYNYLKKCLRSSVSI